MNEMTLHLVGKDVKSQIRFLKNGAFEQLRELLKGYPNALIFTDSNVETLYEEEIAQLNVPVYTMQAGEEYKTPETLLELLQAMAQRGLHRNSCLVAIGGGVVGDIGGLASALYMRGIACIQVPTTVLSQVDSSVGGKTAVDFYGVKNLIGAFKQPEFVLADSAFFRTLSRRELRCGLGEIIKHGALNGELFDILCENKDRLFDLQFLADVVLLNVAHKASVVERDERESGLRKSLNLGHTTAHAFELCDGNLSHGEYVLIGLIFEAEMAQAYVECDGEYLAKLKELALCALEERPELTKAEEAAQFALLDKKNVSSRTVVITAPVRKGEYALIELPFEEYRAHLVRIAKEQFYA